MNTDEQNDLSYEVLTETERKQISRKEGCRETKIKKMSHLLRKKIREKMMLSVTSSMASNISIMRNERKQHANYIPIDVC